ncbi:hypothetical protein F3J28_12220 [Enterobacter sp. Ap-1006]|nr:hypothetical protein [Enterobacter sp. Ap-1006]
MLLSNDKIYLFPPRPFAVACKHSLSGKKRVKRLLTKREKAWFFPLCGEQPKINELIFQFIFMATHCRILSPLDLSEVWLSYYHQITKHITMESCYGQENRVYWLR